MGYRGYEFGGPPGVTVITVAITIISCLSHLLCTQDGCPPPAFWSTPAETFKNDMWPGWGEMFDAKTMMYIVGYFLLVVVLHYALPGKYRQGTVLKDGTRLTYKLNATEIFMTLLALCAAMTFQYGADWIVWKYMWEHNLHIITSANIFCFVLSTTLYLASFRPGKHILAKPGSSGNPIYDWWMGRELNPRIGSFDIKQFCELLPGLMGWVFLNLSNAAQQYRTLGRITDSMILTIAFQFWYVLDSHINEPAVLTTMDITSDGFGHMLVFGDMAWLPFTYSLQTRFLALFPVDLGWLGIAGILATQGVGYYIFRSANNQKNKFRTNPSDPAIAHIKSMPTKRGTRLMISGWWGVSRHINYLGDWTMAWAWCLPTGFTTPITYFYVVYFAILLIHRERRDDEACSGKYGQDWEKYKKLVRWRILPGVY